ncbi:MAG: allantoinase AllB [Terrimicrobiaceae bacterium]
MIILRDAQVATASGFVRQDLAFEDGKIIEIGESLRGHSGEEINLAGHHVFPGFVDAHVHFNEPGRGHWEGLRTGSAALAAGGGTAFVDMPLNSDPPVLTAEALLDKRCMAEEKSRLDFALWGGLCPGWTDRIPEMAAAGAVGFKAFLCPSGIEEFPATDAATLREGMIQARQVGLPVAVHAEDPAVVESALQGINGRSLKDFFLSRPKSAEVSAIRMACDMAGETGASLHIVHVSSSEGLAEIQKAKLAGVDVTAETCPHYLLFDAEQAVAIGARAKCSPPLRDREDVDRLWRDLLAGKIDTIGSDHSPAPPDLKTGEDFFSIWGGISGCQHAFVALLGELHLRGESHRAAEWFAGAPARRLGLKKGRLEAGCDADLTIVKFTAPRDPAPPLYRHGGHLYEFFQPSCEILDVIRRGEFLVRDGNPVAVTGKGTFLAGMGQQF